MNNASSNLKEVLSWIADGVDVQFFSDKTGNWEILTTKQFALSERGLELMWRKKPDAFEDVFNKFVQARFPCVYAINKDDAKHFWNAAMEHKDDE